MKKIVCMISILVLSVVLGAALLIGVFSLPTDKMFAHSRESVEFFRSGETPRWSKPLAHTTLDNSTDAVMMSKALYPVENPVFSAMILPSWSYDIKEPDGKVLIWYPARVMADVLEKNESTPPPNGELQVYPRYWHGYLTILKPMLLLAKFEYLRVINLYAQFLLTVVALILLYKKLGAYYVYIFSLVILMMNPVTSVLAFQHTNIFVATLLTVIILLLFNEKLNNGYRYSIFFLLMGILTAYFDFLTYPVVPLGIGLCLYIILNKDIILESSFVKIFTGLFDKCFAWGFGYLGMWCGKVAVASVLTDFDVFGNALNALQFRTSHNTGHEEITYFSALSANFHTLFKGPINALLMLTLLIMLYLIFIKYKNQIMFRGKLLFAFFYVACLPFLWYGATCNHSFLHHYFTYRELVIFLFALFAFMIELLPKNLKNKV